ncbi:hypothetical protein RQP46_011495 [Phenoliferia psychrophenolica]
MRCLDLHLALDESASTRLVRVPSQYTLLELHFIVSALCGHDPCGSQVWQMRSKGPGASPGGRSIQTPYSISSNTYKLPSNYLPATPEDGGSFWGGGGATECEANTNRGEGIIVLDSLFRPSEDLDWAKDARSYKIEDVFEDPENPIVHLKYSYSWVKKLGATITAVSWSSEPEDALPIVLTLDGRHSQSPSTSPTPSKADVQDQMDSVFQYRFMKSGTMSKCSFCQLAGKVCKQPGGCNPFFQQPLTPDALFARISSIEASETNTYRAF